MVGSNAAYQDPGRISRRVKAGNAEPNIVKNSFPGALARTQESTQIQSNETSHGAPMHLGDHHSEAKEYVLAEKKYQQILKLREIQHSKHIGKIGEHTLHVDGAQDVLDATMIYARDTDNLAHERKLTRDGKLVTMHPRYNGTEATIRMLKREGTEDISKPTMKHNGINMLSRHESPDTRKTIEQYSKPNVKLIREHVDVEHLQGGIAKAGKRLVRAERKAQSLHDSKQHDLAMLFASEGELHPALGHQISSSHAATAFEISSTGSVDIPGGVRAPSILFDVEYPLATNQVPTILPTLPPVGAPVTGAPAVVPAPVVPAPVVPAPVPQIQNSTTPQQADGGGSGLGAFLMLLLVVTALIAGAAMLLKWHKERKTRSAARAEEGSFKPKRSSLRKDSRKTSKSSTNNSGTSEEEAKTRKSGTSGSDDVARAGTAGRSSQRFWSDQPGEYEDSLLAKTYNYKKSKSISTQDTASPTSIASPRQSSYRGRRQQPVSTHRSEPSPQDPGNDFEC